VDPEIRFSGKGFDFTVPLGEGMVRPTEGGGKIEERARPKRPALTEYEGDALVRLEIPVFYDGWPRRSVQDSIDRLNGLCFGQKGELPHFQLRGPMPFSGWRFQMDGLPDWLDDPAPQRSDGGALVRLALMVNVLEWNDSDPIDFSRRSFADGVGVGKARALGGVGPNIPLTITLQRPETLLEVAAQVLHDAGRAREIGDLNGIRDVRQVLPAGRVLKLPREE
jgi:hypothetical protein